MKKKRTIDVLDAVKQRRSINFFEPGRLIPREVLHELIDLANLAPSSFNLQPWRVIVVADVESKRLLRSHSLDQSKIEDAAAVFIILADPDVSENLSSVLDSWEKLGYIKKEKRPEISKMVVRKYGREGSEERRMFAVKNAALFAMNLMIVAKGLGLETHAIDGFDEGPMKKAFGIPEDKMIPMLIAIGYRREDVQILPRAFRRPFAEFVSFDLYPQR